MPADSPSKPEKSIASLGKEIDIDANARLQAYDSGPIEAFKATGRGSMRGSYFALVCQRHLVPRIREAQAYASVTNTALAHLVAHGTVDWPPAGREAYVFVYEDNIGQRLTEDDGPETALAWREDQVTAQIIHPVISALRNFRNKDFVHGAIRPSNMFLPTGGAQNVVLGDCLSSPSFYTQNHLYETITRAMADPIARGHGTQADDLYALGVSLAILMAKTTPLSGMSDDEIIRLKIEKGSFGAITGENRFRGPVLDLMRGLLYDDPLLRWTLDDVTEWADGQRVPPRQAPRAANAPRPIDYQGKKYFKVPFLAMDLDLHPPETVQMIEDGSLEQWLSRAVCDDKMLERLGAAISLTRQYGRGASYQDRMVCNVSVALDPGSPLRYKQLHLMGDGVGEALAEATVLKHELSPFADMFSQGVLSNWVRAQNPGHLDISHLSSSFDACRTFLMQKGKMGYGIERCLYTLAPDCGCLSDKISEFYVTTPVDLIRAFDALCKNKEPPALFLDRHSTAFLMARSIRTIEPHLHDLNSSAHDKKILANLRVLAAIQKGEELEPFRGIGTAFLHMLPVVYARYQDRKTRTDIEKKAKRYGESGDLGRLVELLSNEETIRQDAKGFLAAREEYAGLEKEYQKLSYRLNNPRNFGKGTGREVAAVVSSALAAIAVMIMVFLKFL